MSETTTIRVKDKNCVLDITVKSELLEKCPNASSLTTKDLFVEHKLNQYIHNTLGPAVVRFECPKKELSDEYLIKTFGVANRITFDGKPYVEVKKEYFIDGKLLKEEEAKKIIHTGQFNEKFMNEMSDAAPSVLDPSSSATTKTLSIHDVKSKK